LLESSPSIQFNRKKSNTTTLTHATFFTNNRRIFRFALVVVKVVNKKKFFSDFPPILSLARRWCKCFSFLSTLQPTLEKVFCCCFSADIAYNIFSDIKIILETTRMHGRNYCNFPSYATCNQAGTRFFDISTSRTRFLWGFWWRQFWLK
jgi:hypothetical protein